MEKISNFCLILSPLPDDKQKHKADGMMDVVSRKCRVAGCMKRPWYSYDGVRSVLCAEHKTPGMVGYRPPQKEANGGRKRTFEDMDVQHHDHHDHDGGPDLVHDGLDSVGLAAMGMSEEGLQDAGALALDGMSAVVLGQPRIGDHDLEEGDLEAAGMGHGPLDPAAMGHTDLEHHHGLGQRGLESAGLDVDGEHGTHDMNLHPVLPAHVDHPSSLVTHSDKIFQ